MDIVSALCKLGCYSPTQNDVSSALIAAIESRPPKWNYVSYLISLENKLTQAAIGFVFQKAIENAKWGLAKILCELTGDAPDQKTVGDAVQKVVLSTIPLHLIKYFCEESTHKACTTDVDQALCALLACEEKTFPHKWAYIDYLITLTAENKPSQTVIDKALKIMVKSNNIIMVKKLCSIETDNAPSQEARGVALLNAAKTSGFAKAVSLDIVMDLCKLGLHLPTQNEINHALQEAEKSVPTKWDYVDYLKSFSRENLAQTDTEISDEEESFDTTAALT